MTPRSQQHVGKHGATCRMQVGGAGTVDAHRGSSACACARSVILVYQLVCLLKPYESYSGFINGSDHRVQQTKTVNMNRNGRPVECMACRCSKLRSLFKFLQAKSAAGPSPSPVANPPPACKFMIPCTPQAGLSLCGLTLGCPASLRMRSCSCR